MVRRRSTTPRLDYGALFLRVMIRIIMIIIISSRRRSGHGSCLNVFDPWRSRRCRVKHDDHLIDMVVEGQMTLFWCIDGVAHGNRDLVDGRAICTDIFHDVRAP